ncbi:hypothetical protein BO221_07255 [Archangium sp. Cb G35]|uniref:caspase family protein n=1 Tax=Archangium sp. Cb G35 TaxID=1920190 RepID=UPI0009373229|nr:caspase family protein [Archangium sp. Cb G35]OJT25649.1 hypothetical protein BO221_07255 [Archangium sp. Cb G35]
MRTLVILLGLATLLAAPSAPGAPGVRRALVIAHNGSDDARLKPLRYADDDGVLWAEMLQRLGVETTLLVDPDESTRQSRRPVLAGARTPTPQEVAREVARLRATHLAEREAGRETDVLVIYVGHGNTDEAGRSYFTLAGGRLDRSSFYAQVVDALAADYVHVIVDACRASGVVGRRGQADAAVLEELQGMLEREQLAARPHVGALFAESDNGETHEWSGIRAGVFSHVARSGLMGGADVNADGMVEYSELGAFITAALKGVESMPSRLTVYTFAPVGAPRRPMVGPAPQGPLLVLPAHLEDTRLSIEDEAGLRLADVRRVDGQSVELHLPERKVYWVRTPTREARVERSQLGERSLRFQPREAPLVVRGPIEEALLQGLFSIPMDRPFYEQYVTSEGLVPVDFSGWRAPRPMHREPGGWEWGVGVYRAPLEQSLLATGPSVAWRSATLGSGYYGLRSAYALTPFARSDVRLHRLTVQALGGLVQEMGPVSGFMEAAAGWALVGLTYPEGTQGDPKVFAGHLALGFRLPTAVGALRLRGMVGSDYITVDDQGRWDLSYGIELTLQR